MCIIFQIILFLIIYIIYVQRAYYNIKKFKKEVHSIQEVPNLDNLIDLEPLKEDLEKLGEMKYEEYVILIAFVILIILWTTRSGIGMISGWSSFFKSKYPTDGTSAILVSFTMFVIPIRNYPMKDDGEEDKKAESIMDWSKMKEFPWDLLLFLGGGFALADGFELSGLSEIIAKQLIALEFLPLILLMFIICSSVVLMTSVTTNTATTQVFLPILSTISNVVNIHPIYLMIPATIASSFAFLLPVSTGPNMIIIASKRYI